MMRKAFVVFILAVLACHCSAAEKLYLKRSFRGMYTITTPTELKRILYLATGNDSILNPQQEIGDVGPALHLSNFKRDKNHVSYTPQNGGALYCNGREGLILKSSPVLAKKSFVVEFDFNLRSVGLPYKGKTLKQMIFSFTDNRKISGVEISKFLQSQGTFRMRYRIGNQYAAGVILPYAQWHKVRIVYTPQKTALFINGKPAGVIHADGRNPKGGFVLGCGTLKDIWFRYSSFRYLIRDFTIKTIN